MGEVNVFPVEVCKDGRLHCSEVDAVFACPSGVQVPGSRGSLVVRPEAIRFLEPGEQCSSSLKGTVFNEYSLGSRMQYNVQVADKMITIEKLREQRYEGDFDRSVSIGWDIDDSALLDIVS
jgi:spermidine/putrescine transport system ATP-binding protein